MLISVEQKVWCKMLLYIVRHGDPDYSTDSLTERGKKQAEAVAKRLYASKIDTVFTSPMGRAKETAMPLCEMLGIDYNTEEWTAEIVDAVLSPFPNGEMKSISFLQKTYFRENGNILLPYDRAFECQGINQSGMKTEIERIEKDSNNFLERLGYKYENGVYKILRNNNSRVAVFCHGAFARAWLSVLFHIPLQIMWASTDMTHTGVTVIDFKNYENGYTVPNCLCYSDMSHLYSEKLDMKFCNGIEI